VGVINNQSAERQKTYATEHDIGGVMVFDRDGKAVKAYGAPHTSYIVAIDKAGKVVYTGVGGEQDIDAILARAVPAVSGMHGGDRH
jgi:cytochrome oxidase Cu insertion factor (SCO1/SenC/PrrC family)